MSDEKTPGGWHLSTAEFSNESERQVWLNQWGWMIALTDEEMKQLLDGTPAWEIQPEYFIHTPSCPCLGCKQSRQGSP